MNEKKLVTKKIFLLNNYTRMTILNYECGQSIRWFGKKESMLIFFGWN